MRAALTILLLVAPVGVVAQTLEPEIRLASAEAVAPPTPDPRRAAPLNATFTETGLEKILTELGERAGVKVLFDADFRDQKLSIAFQDEPFDVALRQLTLPNRLFTKALDARTIVIVPESPAKHRQYDAWTASGPMPAVRNRAPINLSFTGASLQKVFEALGQAAGIKVLFDSDLRDRRVDARFDGETFEAALDQLVLVHRLFFKLIDASTIVISPDSPAKRRQYEESQPPASGPLGCGDDPTPGAAGGTGSGVRFADGLWIGFATRLSGAARPAPVRSLFQPEAEPPGRWIVDRIVGDQEGRRYVGYRLELQAPTGGPPFRVAVKPLPETSWRRLCRSCPAANQGAKIARYPEPFELGDGGSFALEVMENAGTGEKITDQVTVLKASPGRERTPPARRFKVELTLARDASGVAGGICIRDLESGEVVGGVPRFVLSPLSRQLAFSQDASRRDGKPLSVNVRLALESDGRTASYAVDVWEARELVHSEETRLAVSR